MAIIRQPLKSKVRPRKPNAAQRALAHEEQKLLDKWDQVPSFAKKYPVNKKAKSLVIHASVEIEQCPVKGESRPRSLMTPGGSTAVKESPLYTGSKMLGVGQLHKSNAIPVFQAEDAVDIARMRR